MTKRELKKEINNILVMIAYSTSLKDYNYWKRILYETEKELNLVNEKSK